MQHMLLRYVENLALGLYVELNSDSRVEIFVEDAQRLLGTETQYITYDDTMGQIGVYPSCYYAANSPTDDRQTIRRRYVKTQGTYTSHRSRLSSA